MRPLSGKTISPAGVLEIPIRAGGRNGRFGMLMSMRLPTGDGELVQIMDAAFAEAARRAGEWLVCRPGCTQCCFGAFAINQLDAIRLGEGMVSLRRDDPLRAVEVERRAAEWVAEFGADFPGNSESGLLGESDEEREHFDEYANDAACPALDPATGRCDVYEWRPMTCRVFGPPVRTETPDGESGLGYCELCFAGAGAEQIAECEMQVPHDVEQRLINELAEEGETGETVVAFALLRRGRQ